MSRRITWSILLLLLTSVQSFAVACNVRCALMATDVKAAPADNTMRGMEHCDSMSSAPTQNGSAPQNVQDLHTPSLGATCCDDLSFAKDPGTVEQIDAALHPVTDASVTGSITLPMLVRGHERPPAYSSTILPSNLIPLASNLRI
jgi:hypothetical protein